MLHADAYLPARKRALVSCARHAGGKQARLLSIAAAFNTPLAGVMFAIEELARTPEKRSSGLIIAAIVLA
ncbi:chloride channel protein [Massilia sp. B-10]|nr:chloride channel protein [Massilia sp. B-10]